MLSINPTDIISRSLTLQVFHMGISHAAVYMIQFVWMIEAYPHSRYSLQHMVEWYSDLLTKIPPMLDTHHMAIKIWGHMDNSVDLLLLEIP